MAESPEKALREAAGLGAVKALLARFPFLGEIIASYDAYREKQFELYVGRFLASISEQVSSLERERLQTPEGQQFVRKVFDCAVDGQLEDRHQLFANALVNGIQDKELANLEKLKFVDMLRQLSLASLVVLRGLHKQFEGELRHTPDQRRLRGALQVSDTKVIETVGGDQLDPFLVESALRELKAVGLLSRFTHFRRASDGKLQVDSYTSDDVFYSDFTARFVEFISDPKQTPTSDNSTFSRGGSCNG